MDRREFSKTLATLVAATAAGDSIFDSSPAAAAASRKVPLAPHPGPKFLQANLDRYNPIWNTPSASSLDSMPLSGAQGTGLNVWVQDDAVCFYIGRNDAYDEDGNLVKLGCVQLRLDPNPFIAAKAFQQKLDLYTSQITIQAKDDRGDVCKILLWLDTQHATVIVEIESSEAVALQASFLSWRDQKRPYPIENWNFASHRNVDVELRRTTPDHIEAGPEALLWYHQNDNANLVVESMVHKQVFAESAAGIADPSRNLIFGGMLRGRDLRLLKHEPVQWQQWEGQSWTYRSNTPGKKHLVTVCLSVEQTSDLENWKQALVKDSVQSLSAERLDLAKHRAAEWWSGFWARSYIFINQDRGHDDPGWQVGRNYQLFRYMLACNRGGTLPLKFNGGIFNVDVHRTEGYKIIDGSQPPPAPPDNRRWANLFMAQNQRLIGWPALMSGDEDMVRPSLDFYVDRLETAVNRSMRYWHHEGAAFVEPLSLYGLPVQALATSTGPCSAEHLALHFSIMIEFAYMALEWASYSGRDLQRYLPLIEAVVRFYDEHYRQACFQRTGQEYGSDGRLLLFPINCLELYANTADPIEVVSGLRRVVESVLALPPDRVPSPMRDYFKRLEKRLPLIHTVTRAGREVLKPAASYDPAAPMNRTEFPEMYAVWPYRLHGLGSRNGNTLAVNTWETLPDNRKPAMDFTSWQCTPIYAAWMGRTADAKRLTIEKLSDKNASLRFTAFFGPGHDWIPDHNWGGSGMVGLQSMLALPADQGLYLLPAWPLDWDVDFQLHLPEQRLVRGRARKRKLAQLTLTEADASPYRGNVILPSAEET